MGWGSGVVKRKEWAEEVQMKEPPRFNWPQKGDKAFALPGHPADSSLLAAFILPSSGGYAVGFKEAADKIIEAAEHDDKHPDLLFFPVAYLYRHSLELSLKEIVEMSVKSGAIAVPDDVLAELLGGHNLYCLWNRTREAIQAVWPEGDHVDTKAVEKVILEFHRLDKSGQAFRYPTDKSGKPHLATAPQCVSLQNLKKVMDAVDRYLDASYAGIDYCDPGPL